MDISIIYVLLFVVLLLLPWKKWFRNESRGDLYINGYVSAVITILKNVQTPQELYDQSNHIDWWDYGWDKACIEYGAN